MKNAHRTELERELERARKANNNTENADIEEIHKQHESVVIFFTPHNAAQPHLCILLTNINNCLFRLNA